MILQGQTFLIGQPVSLLFQLELKPTQSQYCGPLDVGTVAKTISCTIQLLLSGSSIEVQGAYCIPIDASLVISRIPGTSTIHIDSLVVALKNFYTTAPPPKASCIQEILFSQPRGKYIVQQLSTSRSLEPSGLTDPMRGYHPLQCNRDQLAPSIPVWSGCDISQEMFSVLNEGEYAGAFFRCMAPMGIIAETHFLLLIEVVEAPGELERLSLTPTPAPTPIVTSPSPPPPRQEQSQFAASSGPLPLIDDRNPTSPITHYPVSPRLPTMASEVLRTSANVDGEMINKATFHNQHGRSLYSQATKFYAACQLLESLGVDLKSVISARGIDADALIPGSDMSIGALLTSTTLKWTMATFNKKVRNFTWAEEIALWTLKNTSIPCELPPTISSNIILTFILLAGADDLQLYNRFCGIKFLWEADSGALARGVEPCTTSTFAESCAASAKGDWLEQKTKMRTFLQSYCERNTTTP